MKITGRMVWRSCVGFWMNEFHTGCFSYSSQSTCRSNVWTKKCSQEMKYLGNYQRKISIYPPWWSWRLGEFWLTFSPLVWLFNIPTSEIAKYFLASWAMYLQASPATFSHPWMNTIDYILWLPGQDPFFLWNPTLFWCIVQRHCESMQDQRHLGHLLQPIQILHADNLNKNTIII